MRFALPFAAIVLIGFLSACPGGEDGNQNNQNQNNQNENPIMCGDGEVEGAEECDDGAQNSDTAPDACRTDCREARCGDGVMDAGEACDDGPGNSDDIPDACRKDCTSPRCGDGVVDVERGELCDRGPDQPGDSCSPECQVIFCGNGVVEDGEVCDDGDNTSGDGCSADCLSDETCGNGRVDHLLDETCDCGSDPNLLPAGCDAVNGHPDSDCTENCKARYCGNEALDPGEVCDDGNWVAGDGCSPDCLSDESCGNGITDVAASEGCDCGQDATTMPTSCDYPNGHPLGSCTIDCQTKYCGNGVLNEGEVCDDGNTASGDGCSADCRSEEICGNGYVDAVVGEQCDDGNSASHDGCNSLCGLEVRQWAEQPFLNRLRSGHSLAWHGGLGAVVLFGGWDCAESIALSDTWQLVGGDWLPLGSANAPSARFEAEMAWDSARNRLVLHGGRDQNGNTVGDTWEHDGADWSLVITSDSPGDLAGHAMAFDSDRNQVILQGGASWYTPQGATWAYDGSGWSKIADGAEPGERVFHSMAYDPIRHRMVLFGGICRSGQLCDDPIYPEDPPVPTVWEHDGSGWTAIPLSGSFPGPRQRHRMAWHPGLGKVLLVGGCGQMEGQDAHEDAWAWDGANWSQLTSVPSTARFGHAMAWDADRARMVLYGGKDETGNCLGDTWVRQGSSWSELDTPVPPSLRSEHLAVFHADLGLLILYGGRGPWGELLEETWAYDGIRWTELSPATSPGGHALHAAAYDSVRGRMVIFGGQDQYSNEGQETWEFDGDDWTNVTSDASPAGRHSHAMAYDPQRGRIVLFGGQGIATDFTPLLFGDTWEHDGNGWIGPIPGPNPAPAARKLHAMAFHPGLGKVVLVGGCNQLPEMDPAGCTSRLSDAWTWDGNAWAKLVTAKYPSSRSGHMLATDPAKGSVVLFGGANHGGSLFDTWELGATDWTQYQTLSPQGRELAGMAFHPGMGALVLFGGLQDQTSVTRPLNDTWLFRYQSSLPDEICANNLDDDGDGKIDCEDDDCDGRPCDGGVCVGHVCQ
ncbi:MAG: DUF4215 domain-containing protein [Polyangia bacterium]|jgi:cysteine-rich repeat protein|nr:DUF4215 domain-containing protein [Polyangia bacterium]